MPHTRLLPLIYSGRVRRALQLSEQAHRGVNRKSGDHPYLLHPVAVAAVLTAAGADDDLVCAAYLHDVVEDTSVSLLSIADEFGSRVARLVGAVTKSDTDASGEPLSREDKAAGVERSMATAELDVVALKGGDLLTNISDLIIDHGQFGYEHWTQVFKSPARADFKLRHYLRLADIIAERLAHPNAYPLLAEHLRFRAEQLRELHTNWPARPGA